MVFDIEEVLQQISEHPYIQKTKHVCEVNAAHTEDSVHTHLMQTLDMARKSIDGNFISHPQAKQLFDNFMNRKIEGVAYKDIALLFAFIHDVGKILSFKEGNEVFPMNIQKPNAPLGNTYNPGHEYWGSQLVPEILKNLPMNQKLVEYITTIVRLHGQVFDYHTSFIQFPLEDAIRDVKSRVEGYHLAVLFNSYCDAAYNKPLQPCRELIVQMLNSPSTYTLREYIVS